MKPRLGVVYDQGAAGPAEIVRSLSGFAEVLLLLPDSPHTRRVAPLLANLDCEVAPVGPDLPTVDGVVTFSQRCLMTTAEVADAQKLPGHSLATALALTDKVTQRAVLETIEPVPSCPVTRPEHLEAALDRVGLPAVLKPAQGEGSAFTVRIDSPAQARHAAHTVWADTPDRPLVVEAFLGGCPPGPIGDYVSVEVASVDGVHHVIAVTGKFPLSVPFRERGQFWPAALPTPELAAVRALADRVLTALGVTTGLAHIEVKLTPTGPRLIEVNGRLGGYVQELAQRAAGLDLIALAGRIALGLPVRPPAVEVDRVHYQRLFLPPAYATQVEAVDGVGAVRQLPYAHSYRVMIAPGAALADDRSTQPLGLLCGDAATYADMLSDIARASALLTFTFTDRTGASRVVPGAMIDTEADR